MRNSRSLGWIRFRYFSNYCWHPGTRRSLSDLCDMCGVSGSSGQRIYKWVNITLFHYSVMFTRHCNGTAADPCVLEGRGTHAYFIPYEFASFIGPEKWWDQDAVSSIADYCFYLILKKLQLRRALDFGTENWSYSILVAIIYSVGIHVGQRYIPLFQEDLRWSLQGNVNSRTVQVKVASNHLEYLPVPIFTRRSDQNRRGILVSIPILVPLSHMST